MLKKKYINIFQTWNFSYYNIKNISKSKDKTFIFEDNVTKITFNRDMSKI